MIRHGVESARTNIIRSAQPNPVPHFGELLEWMRAFRTSRCGLSQSLW
jgi:hypothetical protein